ncbi:hypothetical protein BJV77DRAFT_959223 [Russula vinacea]|nr:hypothetical protein BJV77DRAFT_959223 [Russula vinacea]
MALRVNRVSPGPLLPTFPEDLPIRVIHWHYCGVPWTILAICSYDQGRLQLLACGGFPKKREPPTSDGWYLRVVETSILCWIFYWALGTQLVLQNPLSFGVYFMLLMRFFSSRIRAEERALVSFFGDDYVSYRNQVGTGIPFIR